MRRSAPMLTLALAALLALPAHAGRIGSQFRYWAFSNHNDLRDLLAYWAPGPFHVQLEYWDFEDPDTEDRLRPEIGVHLRDRRRSVYTLQYRHEGRQQRLWLMTEQVLGGSFVGRAEVSPILAEGRKSQTVLAGGLDYYWRSYHFASVTVVRDPRDGGLWVVPVSVRLATEANDWLQVSVAPASRRSIGWGADAKLRWLRLGVERNDRFDFTALDNTIYTVGFELPIPRAE